MTRDNFWNDQEQANLVIKDLKAKKAIIDPIRELEDGVEDAEAMAALAEEDGGEAAVTEADALLADLVERFEKLEFRLIFNAEYDSSDCFFYIQAGAGGTESCDWAQMLMRMYLRYMERNDYEPVIISILYEEEAGIKSVMILV